MPAIKLDENHCDFTVHVNLEFDNQTGRASDANFRAMIDRRMDQAKAIWNGPAGFRTFGCCKVRFDFAWKIAGATVDIETVHVTILPGAGKGKERAWNNPGSGVGEGYDTDDGVTYAHELGHVLGLGEEYDEQTGKNLNPQTGPVQSIMGQVDGVVGVLQSHIDQVMQHLGANCPEDCCPPRAKDRHAGAPPHERKDGRRAGGGAKAALAVADASMAALARMLRSSDGRAGDARDELVRRGKPAVPELARALRDGPALASRLAAGALADIGGEAAAGFLIGAITDPRIATRLQAAYGLATIGNRSGIPVLVAALTSPELLVGCPPGAAWRFALNALESATGYSLGHPAHPEQEVLAGLQRDWWSWCRAQPSGG